MTTEKIDDLSLTESAKHETLGRLTSRTKSGNAAKSGPVATSSDRPAYATRSFPFRPQRKLLDPRSRMISLSTLAREAELAGKRLMLEIRDVNPVRFIEADSV